MRRYTCPNNCILPPIRKTLMNKNGKWSFVYPDFMYCPRCGAMLPQTCEKIEKFFSVYVLDSRLDRAKQLIYKSEFDAAAREAFVVVETVLRDMSGLDLHGVNLVTNALNYEIDKKSGVITKEPLIRLNNLSTDSERNEQEGVRFMLMGFFQGARNIYQHNEVEHGLWAALPIIIQASFFLYLLDGNSITKDATCVWSKEKVSLRNVYSNMPNPFDRIRLFCTLRFKKR